MRWLGIGLLVVLLLLTPSSVLADSSEDVTVTATGYICEAPGGFTLTYVTDYEVGISWTKGADAVNTMVRVKYGEYPQTRADGYLVYYGEDTNFSDSSVVLAGAEIPYYRAWGQNAGGVWEESGTTEGGFFMSASFLFIGLILIAGLLTFFALRVGMLLWRLAAAMAWLGLGIWLLLSDSTNLQMSDTWTQVIGTVFILMTIAVLTLQIRTDIRHERSVRGKQGYPGAETESYTTWGPTKRSKKPTAVERQANYKETLREKLGRKR